MERNLKSQFTKDIFSIDNTRHEETITNMPLKYLLDFHTGERGHVFPVQDDEDMRTLRKQIEENGILEPIIVRPDKKAGYYEKITGHRRCFVAKQLGIDIVPIVIRNYDDREALSLMVNSNLSKRTIIAPSVLAKAYKIYMDANKKQGKQGDGTKTITKAAKKFNTSERTIQRYIKLNNLIEPLLSLLDDKNIKFNVGEALAFFPEDTQMLIWTSDRAEILNNKYTVKLISVMQNAFKENKLKSAEDIKQIKENYFKNQPKRKGKITVDMIDNIIPTEYKKRSTTEKLMFLKRAVEEYIAKV